MMFESLAKNLFSAERQNVKEEDQSLALNSDACDTAATPVSEKEEEKETNKDVNMFRKDGFELNRNFRLYFSFENPHGTTRTFQVVLDDLLKDHGDISLEIMRKEAVTMLNRRRTSSDFDQEMIELMYEDPSGKCLGIEVERELTYALKEFATIGSITIVVSAGGPKEHQGTHVPVPQVVVPLVPTVTPTKKRATGRKNTGPRKKTKAATASVPTSVSLAPGVAQQPDTVPSNPQQVGADGNPVSDVTYDQTTTMPVLSGVASKIYMAMAEMHALGIPQPQRHHVALLAGYSNVKSTGFAKALSAVKQHGLIEYPSGDTLCLSSEGVTFAPTTTNKPKTNVEMKMRLLEVVKSPKAGEVYKLLFDGKVHDRAELAMMLGYTNMKSTGFAKALSKLGGLGIIHYPDSQTVQLTDIAFPYGRPL